jgi:hypothetical protein
MPIAIAPWVSEKDANTVQESLLALRNSEEGKLLLKHLSWPGFTLAEPEEYEELGWVVKQMMQP